MSSHGIPIPEPRSGGFDGAVYSAPQPLVPLLLVKRRAVDLCRVDSCLCRSS